MPLDNTCTATGLIARLQELVAKHGDLPVYAHDPDTGNRMAIGLMYEPADPPGEWPEDWPERFEIKTDYNGRPTGDLAAVDQTA